MVKDFKDWLHVTPDQHREIARSEYEQASKNPLMPGSVESAKARTDQWARFGVSVVNRFNDDTYQRLITYALLAGASPALVASMVKDYITTGKLPWRA